MWKEKADQESQTLTKLQQQIQSTLQHLKTLSPIDILLQSKPISLLLLNQP